MIDNLEMRARWHPSVKGVAIVGCATFFAACSSPSGHLGGASPISETASVRKTEALIGDYAAVHEGGAETGKPAGYEGRIIGENGAESMRHAYIELLCSALSGRPLCERHDDAFDSQATVTIRNGRQLMDLSINDENDEANWAWIKQHFPKRGIHVEDYGPRYGNLLDKRLRAKFPCH